MRFAGIKSLRDLDRQGWVGWVDLLLDGGNPLSLEEFKYLLGLGGYFSRYDSSNPRLSHPVLSSGEHSDLYLDPASAIAEHPGFAMLCAHALMEKIKSEVRLESGSWLVGASSSAEELIGSLGWFYRNAYEVDVCCGLLDYNVVYGERQSDSNAMALLADVLVGDASLLERVTGVMSGNNLQFCPFLFVLASYCDLCEGNGLRVVPVFTFERKLWDKDECPCCQRGSEALSVS